MDAENESRPLLHSFEHETWRSRMRKRCFRIPSEITITGIILGLFLIVVTSLIMLENLQSTKENEIKLDEKLLASPFKYNKKALDPSWQDKRDSVKDKKNFKERKWDQINKSWKYVSDPSGLLLKSTRENQDENWKDEDVNDEVPDIIDEYGKELDDSWELPLQLGMSKVDSLKDLSEDEDQIKKILLSSKLKLKEIDDGWNKLSKQGWKDKEIRKALFMALKDRRKALETSDDVLQSPMNSDQMWQTIKDSWNKYLHKGDKESENQKSINDDWKSKMNLLQSPKSPDHKEKKNHKSGKESFDGRMNDTDISGDLNIGQITKIMDLIDSSKVKWKKIDDGWRKLSEQGWKEKDIRRALVKALLNRNEAANDSSVLQSPMNFDDLLNEITKKWNKGGGGKDHQGINNDWKNKMNILRSPQASDKKWKKVNDGWKSLNNHEWKNKDNEDASVDVSEDSDDSGQSPMSAPSILGELAFLVSTLFKKDSGKSQPQKSTNDKWTKQMSIFQSPKSSDKKWKKDKGKGTQSDQSVSNKDVEKSLIIALKETEKLLQVPEDFEKFLDDVIQIIKDLQANETNSREDGNDDQNSEKRVNLLQASMPRAHNKWKERDDGWKKLSEQGWSDKEIRDALDKAWKDGDKITQSSNGSMKWKKVNDGWKKIYNKSVPVPTRCPISKAHKELLLGSPTSSDEINCALLAEEARKELGKCVDLSFLPKSCKPSWRTKCFSLYKYRKMDGTCNNKIHPTWGKSGTPYVRMIAPDYADGVSAIRRAKNDEPLPNARLLSKKLYSKRMKPDADTSVLFLYFGLIVDHDMVETAVNSESIHCCDEEFYIKTQSRPKECLQIDVPDDDPFYGPRHVKCLNLVRSTPVIGECRGRREQLNKATSYLDASAVYGSTIQQAKTLRTFSRGQLQTQLINNTPFMGIAKGAGYSCGTPKEPLRCFEAGDSRVNMMVELTAMHTIWYREHNRIATKLHKLNPHWIDEVLFQETRRILIGELQHIAYNEFLPLLLGEKAVKAFELEIDESEKYDGYDDTVDASAFNVFAAAAFRFGHSLVPDMQYLLGPNNSTISKVPLHETFFNANLLYHNGLDLLLRGAASQRTYSVDSYITPEVLEHLFQPANLDYGHDLAAVGIQRGRDHGLPPYTKWRSICGLSEIKNWKDLYSIMDKERADMFQKVYSSVDDIDLIPGALAENYEGGSLVGPTYTCLIGRQFKKTRKGDRFWFEEQNEIGSFTRGQLDQIYKSNMARIICDNSDDIKTIQRHPLKVPSDHNVVLDCSGIPKVDLSEWRAGS